MLCCRIGSERARQGTRTQIWVVNARTGLICFFVVVVFSGDSNLSRIYAILFSVSKLMMCSSYLTGTRSI
jgi:bacteriorhodopsin